MNKITMMKYLISVVVVIALLVMKVESYPICFQTCYTDVTTNVSFLNNWLSLHHESEGIDQLRRHKSGSIVNQLLKIIPQKVANTVSGVHAYILLC